MAASGVSGPCAQGSASRGLAHLPLLRCYQRVGMPPKGRLQACRLSRRQLHAGQVSTGHGKGDERCAEPRGARRAGSVAAVHAHRGALPVLPRFKLTGPRSPQRQQRGIASRYVVACYLPYYFSLPHHRRGPMIPPMVYTAVTALLGTLEHFPSPGAPSPGRPRAGSEGNRSQIVLTAPCPVLSLHT